eukprot:CAMPEP_0178399646 /NCGR_PEP_ID=MMETSP0689_2-20121128/15385_1 /TAXON_ID=160604 /ORGANISM="Amphidinium massartii, Strain CS-259" /LENGTH=191 /DNA_ID=CAMNT_0020020425 /DNA_START=59 /DNA_END=634 /DNA_ORIENTATION=+
MARAVLALALCAAVACASAQAFVQPGSASRSQPELQQRTAASKVEVSASHEDGASGSSALLAASVAVGAVLGFISSRRQQIASATAAGVVGLSTAANAMVDYSGLAYLGGSDKVDINNANVQAYRQFPGMYPTIAGLIGSNGPYKSVQDIYNIKGLTEPMKSVLKQYEANFVCFPADPAYFIDRVNNGLYR